MLVGCSPTSTAEPTKTSNIPVEVTPEGNLDVEYQLEGNIYATPVDYSTTDKFSVGFSPGKYHIDNLIPGRQADLPITLHNGSDEVCTLIIAYRIPDFVDDGYVMAPSSASGWLIIPDKILEIRPREKKETILTIDIPEGATTTAKWEFWVSIKDSSQTGMVQTEGCMRVFVNGLND